MTVSLPTNQDVLMPLVRICVMVQGHWTDGTQPWEVLPVPQRTDRLGRRYYGKRNGYELDSVEEPPALPLIGAAVFHFDYGSINGTDYTVDDTDQFSARDLLGYDVRIQMAPAPTTLTNLSGPVQPAWATVFLGTVIAQDDEPWADDQVSAELAGGGRRTYRCADLLWRTQRWPMNRHTAVVQDDYASGSGSNPRMYVHSYGHPGYNSTIQGYYRRLFGNRWAGSWPLSGGAPDPFGDSPTNLANYLPHSWAGAGSSYVTTWTDLQAVNHALAASRMRGEPCLAVKSCDSGGSALSVLNASKGAWEVSEGESCWDFINRILARQRSRGLARMSWSSASSGTNGSFPSENSATASVPGNIYPFIVVYPQFLNDITFTPPGGSTTTYYGATTCATSVAVDLAGDHRVNRDGITFTQNETASVDYLESFGEPIEILVTLSPKDGPSADGTDGTLAKRWSSSDETDFAALDQSKPWLMANQRWKYVWQRWSLRPNWDFFVGDGNGGSLQNANWYCANDGTLTAFSMGTSSSLWDSAGLGTASPLTCRLLSDMPIYEGYDYTSNATTRYDGSTDTLAPPRLPPLLLANDGSGKFYDVTTAGYGVSNDDFGLLISSGSDIQNGTRGFSATGVLGNVYSAKNLVVSVGLQLSHRVRFASHNGSYTTLNTPRKKALYFPGIFLWIADSRAIWSMYDTGGTNAYGTPKTGAAGGTSGSPGILRDDRASLMSLHNLAWAWYSVTHRAAQWSMRDCGLLPTFTSNGASVNYPTVGQFVPTLTCSQVFTINTPITRKVYDAKTGTTTWFTDWGDLDLSQ